MKSTLATQMTRDSALLSQSSTKRSTAVDDDEDIFGFGDQPAGEDIKEKRKESSVAPQPASRKRNVDEDEDDIFGFSPVKKPALSRPTQRTPLKESTQASIATTSNTALVHSPPKTSSLISSEKVTPRKIMDTSVIFQGFIGKGDISFKPKLEKKEEGDEYNSQQLCKSLCKVTLNISLLRTSQPRPSYVPAPEPELLGRPTPNYKNFKKQQVGRPNTRVKVPLGRYTATKNQPGVEEWLAENPDISRVEVEEETRHKQEDGFWDFLNSQEVKSTGRKQR